MNSFTPLLYAVNRLRWRLTQPLTLGVRLLLVKDSTVLLVKHTYQPYWFLVGGGVKKNETLEQAARREASEEVSAHLGHLSLFGVYTNFFDHKSDHVVVFVCNDFTMAGRANHEIAETRFFALDRLPENIAAGHRRRITEYLDGSATIFGVW